MTSQFFQTSSTGDRIKDDTIRKERPYKIFFKDLFLFKENEVAAKKKERLMSRNMKIHQKTTFSSRMKSRSHLSQLTFYAEGGGGSYEDLGLDPTLILRLTEGADRKRTVHEFINDQRDRFLLEYAVSTKRNTIQRFEKLIAMKENQLRKAEKKLQADAIAFEEFLRENDQRSVDALKMAAQETINKLHMTTELKKASMEVQAVKRALSVVDAEVEELAEKKKNNVRRREQKKSAFGPGVKKSSMFFNRDESMGSEDSLEFFLEDETLEFDLMPEIYFKEPEELLQVLTELEEQNLTLVQYSQDVDENLEDVNKRERFIQDKINNNIAFLLEHKKVLKTNCELEEEKAAELELRSRLFSFGEFNSDTQDAIFPLPSYFIYQLKRLQLQVKERSGEERLIDSLSKKINQVYRVCIGDAEVGSLNAVQKLVKVESRLVELSDLIESIPKENVEAIERIKQKERRQKLREEKMREKQRHQEERLRAALERAVAQPKKKLGRRLVYRSKPQSDSKQELVLIGDTRTKTQEEEYFFS
ncbi:coiled-coil domain-containing protein 38 [Alexandromys fortis]|uniref:coiled-coil domain-containing protein 38 n=1 Tax=Alexandromys fortis TaxID=100897 RepID=UPI0021524B58|nr:coiled-coil domain-containing protein 38 [Microtus fortis]